MPFYLFKGRYTAESIKAMIANPQDREAAVRPMIEGVGGKLHHLFFAMGEDDVVALIEAPDDAVIASVSMVVGASGTMSAGSTTKLFTAQEAVAIMKAAGAAGGAYKPVTG